MVKTCDVSDLVCLQDAASLLAEIMDNLDKYDIINFECAKGTSRTEVPSPEDDPQDHPVQKLELSVVFMKNEL